MFCGLGDPAGEEEPHPYVIQVVPASTTWCCSRITGAARTALALCGWTRVGRDSWEPWERDSTRGDSSALRNGLSGRNPSL